MKTRKCFGKVQLVTSRSIMYFLTFMLCSVCFSSSAFGQTTTYSDTWFDGESSQSYMVGSGVTEEAYMGYGHETWVNTTLTSPSGITASASGGGGSYSLTEVSIEVDLNNPDLGEFFTESSHGYFCPIAFREFNLGSTYDVIGAGVSQACYIYQYTSLGIDSFDIASGCFAKKVSCPGSGTLHLPAILQFPKYTADGNLFIYSRSAQQ